MKEMVCRQSGRTYAVPDAVGSRPCEGGSYVDSECPPASTGPSARHSAGPDGRLHRHDFLRRGVVVDGGHQPGVRRRWEQRRPLSERLRRAVQPRIDCGLARRLVGPVRVCHGERDFCEQPGDRALRDPSTGAVLPRADGVRRRRRYVSPHPRRGGPRLNVRDGCQGDPRQHHERPRLQRRLGSLHSGSSRQDRGSRRLGWRQLLRRHVRPRDRQDDGRRAPCGRSSRDGRQRRRLQCRGAQPTQHRTCEEPRPPLCEHHRPCRRGGAHRRRHDDSWPRLRSGRLGRGDRREDPALR